MAGLTSYRLTSSAPQIPALLALLQEAFAYMDGRIEPPSSLHRLDEAGISTQAETGEIWVIADPPVACMFLTPAPDHLYLGKLAVAQSHRGRGFARSLIALAIERAIERQLPKIVLNTRIELTENQRMFEAMGFHLVARTAHRGYDHPTTCTYELAIK